LETTHKQQQQKTTHLLVQGEDKHAVGPGGVILVQELLQSGLLVCLINHLHDLLDSVRGREVNRANCDLDWVHEEL